MEVCHAALCILEMSALETEYLSDRKELAAI
jgi:hypothetical protein